MVRRAGQASGGLWGIREYSGGHWARSGQSNHAPAQGLRPRPWGRVDRLSVTRVAAARTLPGAGSRPPRRRGKTMSLAGSLPQAAPDPGGPGVSNPSTRAGQPLDPQSMGRRAGGSVLTRRPAVHSHVTSGPSGPGIPFPTGHRARWWRRVFFRLLFGFVNPAVQPRAIAPPRRRSAEARQGCLIHPPKKNTASLKHPHQILWGRKQATTIYRAVGRVNGLP